MTKPFSAAEYSAPNSPVIELPLAKIRQSELNPRKHFDEAALTELTNSIRLLGVEQAITVRTTDSEEASFEIVMGERRFRAATAAGLETIPARVIECSDEELVARALAENLIRSDLSCIETARGYKALADRQWTQEKIAGQFGTDQPQVSLLLGLLKLPEYVQGLLQSRPKEFSKSHGFALLPLADEEKACNWLAKCVLDESLSEKDLRERVRTKRREIDDAKAQPRIPGTDTWRSTTDTGKGKTSLPAPASAKETNGLKREDSDKEFAAAMAPDPLVTPLSELPSPAPTPTTETATTTTTTPTATPAPAASGSTISVLIGQQWDDWLWENDLPTVDAAMAQLAELRMRPQLSPLAHKALKAICPEGIELSQFLEDVLVGRARSAGVDIAVLSEIPE